MKFRVTMATNSLPDGEEKTRLESVGVKFKPHTFYPSRFDTDDTEIDIGSIEELMKFVSVVGNIIIFDPHDETPELMIYNDYVE